MNNSQTQPTTQTSFKLNPDGFKFKHIALAVGAVLIGGLIFISLPDTAHSTKDVYQAKTPAAQAAYDKAMAELQTKAVAICNNELKEKAKAKIDDELNSASKEDPQMDTWNAVRKADCSKAKVSVDWGF